jgi:hypothetical protein
MNENERRLGTQNKNLLEANKDLRIIFLAIFQRQESKLGGSEGIMASNEKVIREVQKLLEEICALSAPRRSHHFVFVNIDLNQ